MNRYRSISERRRIAEALFLLSLVAAIGCQTSPKKTEKEVSAGFSAAASARTLEERLRLGIDRRISLGTAFGMAAAFLESTGKAGAAKSEVVVAGKKSIEPPLALKETDALEIGEISHVFVGILIHLASIEGKLKLESRIDEILPEWVGKPEGVTTVQSLGTRSPGAGTSIGSADFSILGRLLEKVYHRPYRDLFRDRIARPLKLLHAGKARQKPIRGFDPAGVERAPERADGAEIGIVMSAREMRTFLAALVNAAVETPGKPKSMFNRAIDASMASGIGWNSRPGENPLRKSGKTGGFASTLFVDRVKSTALMIVSPMAIEVENLGAFALGVDAKDQTVARMESGPKPVEADVNRLKGRYVLAEPKASLQREFEISERTGRLVIRFGSASSNEREGALLYPVEPADEDEKEWGLIGNPEMEKRGTLHLIGEKEIRIRYGGGEYRKSEEKPESYPAYEKD